MTDPEKVIYSIERCICHVPDACRNCAYDAGHPYNECVEMMLKDALSLLKAQEPLAVRETELNKCVCGNEINRYWHPEFCGFCGKKLEWY